LWERGVRRQELRDEKEGLAAEKGRGETISIKDGSGESNPERVLGGRGNSVIF
jgi:hypothetical protein